MNVTEYIQAIKINNYQSHEETIHAADPAKVEVSPHQRTRYYVTTRCGIKHSDPVGDPANYKPFARAMYCQTCQRCEQLIAKENAIAFAAEDHADEPAVQVLVKFAKTLPADHRELPGVLRAIEVLKLYGQPLVHLGNKKEVAP